MFLNVNGLWCMFQRSRNKECKCKKKCDWKCKDLLTNKNKWQCEDRLCRCQQQYNIKWLNNGVVNMIKNVKLNGNANGIGYA